ncbi:DUF3828 domain-containing protein [uncultured Chitinophaga sp.]|jgi:hypothetical protein|uniref:DUF3828 domain-containing protein n=1 Tax=uncultured Chitinophaga sp. TaxID=339340 RepID=UPI002633E763|nr:DUF3828 domain-containing protein [uncultured Chitinophaga sp.]
MKPTLLISFLIAAFGLLNFHMPVHAAAPSDASMEMLKQFYKEYIREMLKSSSSEKKLHSIRKQYCTTGLLNKIESAELDYDPFLNARDADEDWLKTLSVSKDPQRKKDGYIISLLDSDTKTKTTVKLIVIKEKERYKIDAIVY